MWTFFFLVIVTVVLGGKISSLREENRQLAQRIDDLHAEISASRVAFLKRVEALEGSVVTAEPQAAPEPETIEQSEEAVAPPAAEEPAEEPTAPALPPSEDVQQEAPSYVPFDTPEPVFHTEPEPRSGIEWERLIGVRGAAILGAIVLGLAAMLFLQYSIEHGLIPPIVRVAIGLVVGAGALAGSEIMRKRGYATTANALAGGGSIVLYASVWAARNLYELIGVGLAFALMALITAACGALSWRHSAREIAVLGLAGGFATPLLISSGQDNPIGLFGYLLLLNTGLFLLARERGWPLLSVLGLAGTTFYQAGWIIANMGPERTFLGLSILAVFALFFAVTARYGNAADPEHEDGALWQLSQAGGVLLPFALALYFAAQAELSQHLYPVAGLLALLCGAALWIHRLDYFPVLPRAAAAASVAIFFVWSAEAAFTPALSWEAVLIAAALALVFHVFEEPLLHVDHNRKSQFPLSPASLAAAGFLFTLSMLPLKSFALAYWPWLVGLMALGALLIRQAQLRQSDLPWTLSAVLVSIGLSSSLWAFGSAPEYPLLYTVALLGAVAFQALALRAGSLTHSAERAAAAAALVLSASNIPLAFSSDIDDLLYLGAAAAFALLAALAATRLASGGIYFAAVALAALSQTLRVADLPFDASAVGSLPVLVALFLSAVAFTLWPIAVGGKFLANRWTTYGAALAGPLWFVSLTTTWEHRFGDGMIGIVPLLLGALSLGAAMRIRQILTDVDRARLRGLVWFAAVALSFIAVAIPMQLDKEWITIGWAIQGFALLQLWKRLDHPGLKYFALMLLSFTVIRLLLNPQVFEYYARSGRPVFNWMMYGYLVPAAALVGGAVVLSKLELARARPSERNLYASGQPWGAVFCFSSAILVVFAWINLTIFDAFSAGRVIEFTLERQPARDLTLSAAWAVFAIGLLGLAFRTNTQALRWTSLAFLLLTIGKVFLYDLGELEDLYRVASLVGLAASLLLVSMAYQRFVFGRGNTGENQ